MLQQGILGRRQILKTTVFLAKKLSSSFIDRVTSAYKITVNLSINLKCGEDISSALNGWSTRY